MNLFEQEVREKSVTARSAGRRKRGAGSRCTLPSDYLTAAQLRALNGPVILVRPGKEKEEKDGSDGLPKC